MDTDGLILNIRSDKKFQKSKKPQITGTRRERIKQRRDLKHKPNLSFNKFSEFDSGLAKTIREKPRDQPRTDKFTFHFDQNPRRFDKVKTTINKLGSQDSGAKRVNSNESTRDHGDVSHTNLSVNTTAKHSTTDEEKTNVQRIEPQKVNSRIVSSLFKNNPHVPVLTSSTVEGIKEEVFSKASFSDLPLQKHLLSLLEDKNAFTKMTRVQQEAIPKILEGRDVLIKSQTGSGKTLSYAVPIVQLLQAREPRVQRSHGVHALVIVPTRELAIQSFNVFHELVNSCCWVVPGCLMGGEKRKAEKARIRKGINILVSTPGRLLDHMEHTSNMLLDNVQYFVIDEADRLLDLGFELDISKIVNALKKRDATHQQTVLLSATLSDKVERLAGMTLRDPSRIYVSRSMDVCLTEEDRQRSFALPQKLRQLYVIVPAKLRLVTLAAFVLAKLKYSSTPNKLVIFLSTQDSVSFHYDLFTTILLPTDRSPDSGVDSDGNSDRLVGENKQAVFRLHGDMPQKERSKVYRDFHAASSGVLLCTDVAARGLDLPRVTWIIQYTTPGHPNDYIHRVGRTARIGTAGHALLFLLPAETAYIDTLASHHINVQAVDMNAILKPLRSHIADLSADQFIKRQKPNTVEECATFVQMSFENYVFKNQQAFDLATKAFLSFIRAYATYPSELKGVFHVKKLHLGHLAKSFALSEAPTKLGAVASQEETRKRRRDNRGKQTKMFPATVPAMVSEFGSGIDHSANKRHKS